MIFDNFPLGPSAVQHILLVLAVTLISSDIAFGVVKAIFHR